MNLPNRRNGRRSRGPELAPQHSGRDRNLLIWLSGADTDTLALTPRERRKFIGLGGVVLTTACLAAVSATFALNQGARAPTTVSALVGIFWGLAIMNLDRWLVSATQRRARWQQNVLSATPRLLMALIIGAVISTPLVLWIFQREIEAELNVLQQQKLDKYQQSLLTDARFKRIAELEANIARLQPIADGTATYAPNDEIVKQLQAQYNDLDTRYREAQASATCEFDGTCGTKTRGGGPAYQQKLQVAQALKQQRDEVKTRLDAAVQAANERHGSATANERKSAAEQLALDKAELERLTTQKKAEEDRFAADARNDDGLLARLEALSSLTGRNATLRTAYILLLLFITTIEVMPVLVKLLMNLAPPTAYDAILDRAEKTDIETADAELDLRKNLALLEYNERAAREEAVVRTKVEQMVKAESLVYEEAVRQWQDGQLNDRSVPQQRSQWRFPRLRLRRAPVEPAFAPWPTREIGSDGTRGGDPSADYEATEGWTYDQ